MSTLKQYTRAESLPGAACSFPVRDSHFTCLDISEAALHERHMSAQSDLYLHSRCTLDSCTSLP